MYAIDKLNCSVQITGSHNSLDYNGFKISYDRKPFFGKDIINLKDPKARRIVKKYRKAIEKSADDIMKL